MTNQKIRAVIFDFGNVLVKWSAHKVYERFFPDLQSVDLFLKEINFFEWNTKQDEGRSFAEGVAVLSKQFPHYAELIQAYDTHWEESLTQTIDETIEIAKIIKEAGYKLFLLTNSSAEKFELAKQKYDFLQMFDDMIVSGEHKLLKPDHAIYHFTLNRIGYQAEECVFIDDSLPNVESAKKLGFYAIHYQSPALLKHELQKLSILPN